MSALQLMRIFEDYIGMPDGILMILSGVAGVFCFYSMSCYLLVKHNWRKLLLTISIANVFYVCVTAGLAIYFHANLTILGAGYFIGEIVVVSLLVYIEAVVYNRGVTLDYR